MSLSEFVGVSPVLSYWRGIYHLDAADVRVGTDVLDDTDRTTPSARCLTKTSPLGPGGKPWLECFREVDKALARLRDQYTIQYRSPMRIIPRRRLQALLNELVGQLSDSGRSIRNWSGEQSLRYRIQELGDDFAEDWPNIRRSILRRFPDSVQERLDAAMPKADDSGEIRNKFGLEVLLLPLADDYEAFAAPTAAAEELERISQLGQQRLDALVESLVAEPRREVEEAARELLRQSHNGQNPLVGRGAILALQSKLDKLRDFGALVGGRLPELVSEIEERLESATLQQGVRRVPCSAGLQAAAGALVAAMQDTAEREANINVFAVTPRAGRRVANVPM